MVCLIIGLSIVTIVEIVVIIWLFSLNAKINANQENVSLKYSELLDYKSEVEELKMCIDEIKNIIEETDVDGQVSIQDIQMKDVDENLYGSKKPEDSESNFIVEVTE